MQTPRYKKRRWILLTVLFFPFIVPYLVWAKTNRHASVKVWITLLCLLLIINWAISSKNQREEMNLLNTQATDFISEWKISEAIEILEESQLLNSSKSQNIAFDLYSKLEVLNSDDSLRSALLEMTDKDVELLNNNEFNHIYIENNDINKLFIKKIKENIDNRSIYVEEQKEKDRVEADKKEQEERKASIENQFSSRDGSHIKLTRLIKDAMNDPDSYDHIETKYRDMKDHLIVNTIFRWKNGFWWVVKNTVKAKILIDWNNIEIIE